MKQFIYHDLDSGVVPVSLSHLEDFDITPYPSCFIISVCEGRTVAYSGSLRGLQLLLSNPNISRILAHNTDNKVPDFRHRLDVLSCLVSSLNGDDNAF